jgi:SAM-dependent methyltransferase
MTMADPTAHPETDAPYPAPYLAPRAIDDPAACTFNHTIDLPGHGTVAGAWDLRAGLDDYLGHVAVAGKRVLDFGATSGFLGFALEARGAEVVSYDFAGEACWEMVPYPDFERAVIAPEIRNHLRRFENAYWYSHAALGSRSRRAGGSLYEVPEAIGPVDIAVLGNALARLRDPFRALHGTLRLTRETVVVTEMLPKSLQFLRYLPRSLGLPLFLLPRTDQRIRFDAWWTIAPTTMQEFLAILGFGESAVTYHRQSLLGQKRLCYTVVARRTEPTNPEL